MNEGYVTFVNNNKNYIELTNILIESVLLFSTRHIEVFSINFDYIHSSPKVLSKRITLPEETFETICYSKLYSSFNSSFDNGIQLDSDFIITKNMDLLFEDCKKITQTPLGSLHPSDPNNQSEIMDFLGVKEKTQPYVHATYLFSNNCKPFLEECYLLSKEFMSKNIKPQNFDETILNVMLWKYNANNFVTTYDPYYDLFINRSEENKILHGYGNIPVNFYSCHGEKNPELAKIILKNLINSNL